MSVHEPKNTIGGTPKVKEFNSESRWLNISVDSRNFEMWGQFPPMSEKCGGLVTKNGNLYLRQSGFNFGSICLSVCLLAGLHKCYCMDLHEKKNRRWKLILDHINFYYLKTWGHILQ